MTDHVEMSDQKNIENGGCLEDLQHTSDSSYPICVCISTTQWYDTELKSDGKKRQQKKQSGKRRVKPPPR